MKKRILILTLAISVVLSALCVPTAAAAGKTAMPKEYAPVIEMYYSIIYGNWYVPLTAEDLMNMGACPLLIEFDEDEKESFGCCLEDINGDGTPELFLGIDNTRLLPIRQAHREAEPKEKESYRDAWQNAKNALLQCGKLLEEDDFAGVLTGVIRAGIKDMNPAVVVIDVEQENLKISAYAKEGLFSQHTAEKAIDKLLQAL